MRDWRRSSSPRRTRERTSRSGRHPGPRCSATRSGSTIRSTSCRSGKPGTSPASRTWTSKGDRCSSLTCRRFPGMSGSPVLAVANGVYETEDGRAAGGPDGSRRLLGHACRPRSAPCRRRASDNQSCSSATSGKPRSSLTSHEHTAAKTVGDAIDPDRGRGPVGRRDGRRGLHRAAADRAGVRSTRTGQECSGHRARPRGVSPTGQRQAPVARTARTSSPSRRFPCGGCSSNARAPGAPPSAAAARCRSPTMSTCSPATERPGRRSDRARRRAHPSRRARSRPGAHCRAAVLRRAVGRGNG